MARNRTKAKKQPPRRKTAPAKTKAKKRAPKEARPPIKTMVERVKSGVQQGIEKVRELAGFPHEPLGEFSRPKFMGRLSEFLEHERNGAKLYEQGLVKPGMTEDQLERLREFAEQTNRHIDILTTITVALGGDPDVLSEAALLNRQKAGGLIDTDAEGETGLLNYFQDLMIAEWVDHMNWELLAKVKGKIDDEEVARVLSEHVESIEDEEDEHYRWAVKQVEDLSLRGVFSGQERAEKREEDEEAA